MAIVYLGIGANEGDRANNIERALGFMKEHEDMEILAVSSLIETKPEGGPPQGDFLNGAVKIKTDLLPLELLSQIKIIERRLGRMKREENAPRSIDLDILFYDDVVIVDGKNLTIPHPRMHDRFFVLKPLLEIAPDVIHPRLNRSIKDLYEEHFHESPAPAQGT